MANLLYFHDRFWNPSLYVLNAIERAGIFFDVEVSQEALSRSEADVTALEAELREWAPVENWGSHSQVKDFFFKQKGWPIPEVTGTLKAVKPNYKKKESSDEAATHWLAANVEDPEDRRYLNKLLKYRKAKKYGQFLSKLPNFRDVHGRIHTVLGPDTDTGRLSSRNPSLQQIPKSDAYGIRQAFRCTSGNALIVADFTALEMYVLAHFLKELFDDNLLIEDLLSGDIHTATAKRVWPHLRAYERLKGDPTLEVWRETAKTINYAVNYGKTEFGLGSQILDRDGIPVGVERAKELLLQYFNGYPGIKLYQDWVSNFARKHGGVQTLLGRFRPLPEATSRNEWVANAAIRKALNTPIQGSAADIVTDVMLGCNVDPLKELLDLGWFNETLYRLGFKPILQVHDELIFEGPEDNAEEALKEIKRRMENPRSIKMHIPLKVNANICTNWAEGK